MENSYNNKQIIAENILFYMDKHDKTRKDICKAINIPYTTFTDWIKGNTYPRIDKIELLADYFSISKSELVEKNRNAARNERHEELDIYDAELLEIIHHMSEEEKQHLLSFLRSYIPSNHSES